MSAKTAVRPVRSRRPRPRSPIPAATKINREELDPLTQIVAVYSERERRRFSGAGVRIGSSDVVHERADVRWMLGLPMPAPACHAGFGMDLSRISPARGEVTCKRCKSVRTGSRENILTGQMPLW